MNYFTPNANKNHWPKKWSNLCNLTLRDFLCSLNVIFRAIWVPLILMYSSMTYRIKKILWSRCWLKSVSSYNISKFKFWSISWYITLNAMVPFNKSIFKKRSACLQIQNVLWHGNAMLFKLKFSAFFVFSSKFFLHNKHPNCLVNLIFFSITCAMCATV